ncbi:MAG: hypothetical protein AABX01_05485 [Candidatus Micrarchaeota archaeon]
MKESEGSVQEITWKRLDRIGDHLIANPGALLELKEWNPRMHKVIEAFWRDPRGKQLHRELETNRHTARKRLLRAMEALGIDRKPGKAYSDLTALTPGQMRKLERENIGAHEIVVLLREGHWIGHIAYKKQITANRVALLIHRARKILGIGKVPVGYGAITLATIARTPKQLLDGKAFALTSNPRAGEYHRMPRVPLHASPRTRYILKGYESITPGFLDEVRHWHRGAFRALNLYALEGRPKTAGWVARKMGIEKTKDAEHLIRLGFALAAIAHHKRLP